MTWLDAFYPAEWVDFLVSLFPLAAGGFFLGCTGWLVSFLAWSLFRIIKGAR